MHLQNVHIWLIQKNRSKCNRKHKTKTNLMLNMREMIGLAASLIENHQRFHQMCLCFTMCLTFLISVCFFTGFLHAYAENWMENQHKFCQRPQFEQQHQPENGFEFLHCWHSIVYVCSLTRRIQKQLIWNSSR